MIPPSSSNSQAGYGDDLAAVVVRRLEARPKGRSWGLFKTLVLGIPSFGLIPLLAWPARFGSHVAEESQAMQELAQWAKLRGRQPAAVGPLMAAAEDTTGSPIPLIVSLVLTALVVGVFIIYFNNTPPILSGWWINQLLSLTYLHVPSRSGKDFVYNVWVISLSLGYAVQWLTVRAHAADVRRFVERFNPVVLAENQPPVKLSPGGCCSVFFTLWILTAVVLAMHHAWWGIPMVLAGMAQKRYTTTQGRVVRAKLSRRVRDIVASRNAIGAFIPAAMVPTPSASQRCSNPRCLAALRPHAHFCSRCGGAVNVEQVV